MNRFVPESLLEALLRPFAMAFPDAWIYVEVMAPDFRFVLALVLLLVWGLGLLRGRSRGLTTATVAVCAFTLLSFVTWMATTGNGRYYLPVLMLVGVLCIALIHRLPASRGLRGTLAVAVLLAQVFALTLNHPWKPGSAWGMVSWGQTPVLRVALDQKAREEPATYVGLSVISYSLIASQFPAGARWTNISSLQNVGPLADDARRLRGLLAESRLLYLFAPALTGGTDPEGLPTPQALQSINQLLALRELKVSDRSACRLLPVVTSDEPSREASGAPAGFWICPLSFPVAVDWSTHAPPRVIAAMARLELLCPRRFPPGLTAVTPVERGSMRHYQGADMKLFVTEDEAVFYRHHRSLSAFYLGTVDDVLAPGYVLECEALRSGSGLPWRSSM